MEEKQYYKEKRISNSSLKYFEQSPSTFQKFINSELEQIEKYYLDRGKQIHMAILEPDKFKKNYTVVDFDVPKSEQQKQFCEDYIKYLNVDTSKLGKDFTENDELNENHSLLAAYRDNYKTTGKEEKILEDARTLKNKLIRYVEYLTKRKQFKDILSWSNWNRITSLKEGIVKHKLAKELLSLDELSTKQAWNELQIFWDDPIHNLPCKSMIDRLIVDEENKEIILVDLKTAITFKDFKERCRDLGYFRQMAFYWFAIYWWTKNALNKNYRDYTAKTYIVALKTTDDADVKVFSIEEQYLKEGLNDMQSIMNDVAWHWEENKWEYSKAYYIGDGSDKL